MPKVVIPLSKTKLVLLALAAALFVVMGWWLFQLDAAQIEAHRRYNSPLFVHGIGLVALGFGALGVVFLVRKLFDTAPGLVLDERGLTDNCSAAAAGFIPWQDITGFEVRQIYTQKLIYVMLKDPEAYLARLGGLRRGMHRANMGMAASPVAIVSSTLQIGFDELVDLLNRHFAAHRSG
jgi:hypothetical protein